MLMALEERWLGKVKKVSIYVIIISRGWNRHDTKLELSVYLQFLYPSPRVWVDKHQNCLAFQEQKGDKQKYSSSNRSAVLF